MSTIPTKLNWVEKRAECTVAKVFNEICDGIREDVETLNSVLSLQAPFQFQADMHSSGTTIIVGQPNQVPRKRVFIGIVENRIDVNQEWNNSKWSAATGLNYEGRCILKLADCKELEQWQFRKKALEGLFFGD